MYVMDYLIYHLRPYGIVAHPPPLAERMSVDEAMASVADLKTTVAPALALADAVKSTTDGDKVIAAKSKVKQPEPATRAAALTSR